MMRNQQPLPMIEEGADIPQYRRTRNEPNAGVCRINLKEHDFPLQLEFPDYGIVCSAMKPSMEVVSSHIDYRNVVQLDAAIDGKTIRDRAIAEVAAINLFFPDVRSTPIQICMASWLATLCIIDDMLETMTPAQAEVTLEESIDILREGGGGHAQSAEKQRENQVLYVVQSFKNHCSDYISGSMATRFFAESSNVLQALVSETDYRQGILPGTGSLETYFHIRAKTIGIAPFFSLVQSLFCPEDVDRCIDLREMVSFAAGLQNDLIGLEKDLNTGERMNAVEVALEEMGQSLSDAWAVQEATARISNIHNQTIGAILDILQQDRQEGSETEGIFIHSIVAFAESHMKWCASAKRYQADLE